MNVLIHWIPTFAAGFVLMIAALILDWRIRVERRARAVHEPHLDSIPGVRYLFDEHGARTTVLIDLEKNPSLWEDVRAALRARARR